MFKKNVYLMTVVLVLFYAFLVTACSVKTPALMVSEAESAVKHVSVNDLKGIIDSGEKLVILDVRDPYEFERDHIPGAINMSRGILDLHMSDLKIDKNAKIVVY